MNSKQLGSFAIVTAAILWSLDGLLRRHLYSLPPTVIVFWEHAFGLVILLIVAAFQWRTFKQLSRKQWISILLVSFLSGTAGTILYTAALGKIYYSSYSVVVLLQQLQPFFAISAAAIILKEHISWKYLGLAVIAFVAAYFISFPDLTVNLQTGAGTAIAALMAIGAAACWGTSTAFSKYALRGKPPLQITLIRFLFTAIFALGLSLILGAGGQIGAISAEQVGYIALITFSTGMLALALYYFGLKRVMASRSTLLELTWPLSAALFGFIFLHEQLTLTQWAGTIALLLVMHVVIREQRRHENKNTSKDIARVDV